MKLALSGATGRMGLAILRLAQAAEDIQVVGALCASDDPQLGRDIGEVAGLGNIGVATTADAASALLGADVVIDFSAASAVSGLLSVAVRQNVAVVSGTTGLSAETERALERAAESVPVLWAANMSLGIQVLAEIVEQAIRRLGAAFDVEIVEVHHRRKVDAPSGTARRLGEAVKRARPDMLELNGRSGQVGARTDAEVAVLALRGGDVIGDHTVHLLGPSERLELTHRATSRDLFARGAIEAARYVVGRSPGLYSVADVVSAQR